MIFCDDCGTEYNGVDYWCCPTCRSSATPATNYWEDFICPICEQGFTLAQWDKRHNGANGEEYHEDCCPECKDGTADNGEEIEDDDEGGELWDFAESMTIW